MNIFEHYSKLIALLAIIWFFGASNLSACDVCGCSASGQFMGLLTEVPDNQISINFYQSVFETRHPPSLFGEPVHLKTRETFSFVNINAGYKLGQRWILQAQIPFGFFRQTGYNTQQSGLSDIQFRVNFLALDRFFANSGSSFVLLAGAGVKLPTGRNDALQNEETLNPNLQLGTGSTDFLFFTQSTFRFGNSGLNAELSYRLNTENDHQYRFGNVFSGAARYFYTINGENLSHTPFMGLAYENSQQNRTFGDPLSITGGHLLLIETGYEFFLGSFNGGLSFAVPIDQHLSDGLVSNKFQFTTKFLYAF